MATKNFKFVQLYYDAGGEYNDLKVFAKCVADLTEKDYKFVEGGNACDSYYVGGGVEDIHECADVMVFSTDPAAYKSFIKMITNAKFMDCGYPVPRNDTKEMANFVFNNSTSWPKKYQKQNPFLIKKHQKKNYMDSYEVEFDPNGKIIHSFSIDMFV